MNINGKELEEIPEDVKEELKSLAIKSTIVVTILCLGVHYTLKGIAYISMYLGY